MVWPFLNKPLARYWLKVFAMYALVEAIIQLLFFYILNNYGDRIISNWEFHFIMWVFQCVLIWPIWWMAWLVRKQSVIIQIITAILFYIIYSYFWFGPVQQLIGFLNDRIQETTRVEQERVKAALDNGKSAAYLNYQLLKHGFRLSWFFLANYFYHYRREEKKRMELAIANKDLQLKLLKWHLNPSFYFKTIEYLRKIASTKPLNCTGPILQLARVMEYVIYEVKEKLIDVKKEINFLTNYLNLLNDQPGSTSKIHLLVNGPFDQLKIAPLLLTSLTDKIATASLEEKIQHYELDLTFSGSQLAIRVTEEFNKEFGDFFKPGDPLITRLDELYRERYTISTNNRERELLLNIQLDEG